MYEYEKEKQRIFTDEGQRHFLKIRDKVDGLLEVAGAFKPRKAIIAGDSYLSMACVDRLVELDEVREATNINSTLTHDKIFVRGIKG